MRITKKHVGLRVLMRIDWFKGAPSEAVILAVGGGEFVCREAGHTHDSVLRLSFWRIVEVLA